MPKTFDTSKYQADYSPLGRNPFVSVQDVMKEFGDIGAEIVALIPELLQILSSTQIEQLLSQGLSSLLDLLFPADGSPSPLLTALTTFLGGFDLGGFASSLSNAGMTAEQLVSGVANIPASVAAAVAAAIAAIPTVGTGAITAVVNAFASGVVAALGGQVGADATGLGAEILGSIGGLADTIYNGITSESNNTGTSNNDLQLALSQLAGKADAAKTAATSAYNVTTQFGATLHQLVQDLESAPVYASPLEFLTAAESFIGTTWGNIVTSLSPNNPPIAQNMTQIDAIWAHLSTANTVGISYTFNPNTPLGNNYQGTSNPAFTAPTGFSLPTPRTAQPGGQAYILDTTGITRIAVFTGNPSGAASDHGLITDRHHVSAVIGDLPHSGTAQLFCCGHGTTGLAQHVTLEVVYTQFGSDKLNICTMTGPNTGRAQQSSYTLPGDFSINDVVAIEYDPATNTFTMFYNNMSVGTPWPDLTNLITHGAGYRECGLYDNETNGNAGPGLGGFVAYDF